MKHVPSSIIMNINGLSIFIEIIIKSRLVCTKNNINSITRIKPPKKEKQWGENSFKIER